MITKVNVDRLTMGVCLRTYKSYFYGGIRWGVISNNSFIDIIKI